MSSRMKQVLRIVATAVFSAAALFFEWDRD